MSGCRAPFLALIILNPSRLPFAFSTYSSTAIISHLSRPSSRPLTRHILGPSPSMFQACHLPYSSGHVSCATPFLGLSYVTIRPDTWHILGLSRLRLQLCHITHSRPITCHIPGQSHATFQAYPHATFQACHMPQSKPASLSHATFQVFNIPHSKPITCYIPGL